MKSRWIINLLLLSSIGILALVAWYEPGIEETPQAQTLTTLQQEQIATIQVRRPVRDDLLLARTDGTDWRIEREPPLPADSFQVSALSRLAVQKAARSYPASGLDLSRLGLEPPQATVVLDDTRIEFGSTEPLEEMRYVRVADQVHLIPDIYQHLIEANFTQFVRRRLLPEQSAITGLTLPTLALKRIDQEWAIDPQQEVSADRLQVLLDSWRQAAALSIQANASETEGERITLTLENPEQQILFVIGSRDPELVLLRPELGLEYHMGNLGEGLLTFPQTTPAHPE